MKMNMSAFHDPFLRNIEDIKCPLGMPPHDAAKMQPGPGIARTFEQIADREEREYPKPTNIIFAGGVAVGIDADGVCGHFWAGRGQKFVGFLAGSNETRASVKTRGSIILKLEGATEADRGKPVYCTAPNSFSLKRSAGAAEIGAIRYVQGNRSAVAFRRYDSDKPLPLEVRDPR